MLRTLRPLPGGGFTVERYTDPVTLQPAKQRYSMADGRYVETNIKSHWLDRLLDKLGFTTEAC